MLLVSIKRHKTMIFISIFFFYLGCGITLNFLRIDCADAALKNSPDSTLKYEYAVLILSSPGNELKRDAIRATWMNFANNLCKENGELLYKWNNSWIRPIMKQELVKFQFVIGTKSLQSKKLLQIIAENKRNNDLLLMDSFEDSYKTLSLKVLHSLQWFSENMKRLKYLIKCDDDSFVRIDLIVKDLEAFAPEMNAHEISPFVSFKDTLPAYKGLYWGYFQGKAHVYRSGKWQELNWFISDNYLPYALGGGYVISQSLVDYVAKNADFLSQYNSEDVSMGVWTAALDGINRVHDIRFDTEWKSRGCHKEMLVRHNQTPSDMFEMYRLLMLSHGNQLCKTETVERKSYIYNWDVLPSQCCNINK